MDDLPTLILGPTGSFGGGIAGELLSRGRAVRAMGRRPDKVRERFGAGQQIEIVEGDVQDPPSVEAAAAGCSVIVDGVNYPYAQWPSNMPSATRNVIAAARWHRCAVLFPGNVYGIGRRTSRPLTEAVEMQPCSRKGRLRVALEAALRKATEIGRSS